MRSVICYAIAVVAVCQFASNVSAQQRAITLQKMEPMPAGPPRPSWGSYGNPAFGEKYTSEAIKHNNMPLNTGGPGVLPQRPTGLGSKSDDSKPPMKTVLDKGPSTVQQGRKPTSQDLFEAQRVKDYQAAVAAEKAQAQINAHNCYVAGVGCSSQGSPF
jgi:hypothetical protein